MIFSGKNILLTLAIVACVSSSVESVTVEQFTQNISINVTVIGAANKDACKDDHKKFCGPKIGVALDACMKEHYKELSQGCIDAEFQHFKKESKDERQNPLIQKHCAADITRFCAKYPGDIISCLGGKIALISKACREKVELEKRTRRIDLRLNGAIFGACATDIGKHCKNLPRGRGAVLNCLKEKQRDANIALDTSCQKLLTKDVRKASKDANALPGIHNNCKEDLKTFCANVKPGEGRTHKCLRDNMNKLSKSCKQAEFEHEMNEAKDINAKTNLSKACQADLLNICKIDVIKLEKENKQDDGKAISCLKSNLQKLSPACKAAEFQELKEERKDIRLKRTLFLRCRVDLFRLCKGVPAGGKLRCLKDHLNDQKMSSQCRNEINKDIKISSLFAKGSKLVATNCKGDLLKFCAPDKEIKDFNERVLKKGGGRDNVCLMQNFKLLAAACRKAKMQELVDEAKTYTAKPMLLHYCQGDLTSFCLKPKRDGGVDVEEPGAVLACLRNNLKQLSPQCKKAELKELITEGKDVRLKAKLAAICTKELKLFCDNVKNDEKLKCLKTKFHDLQMGQACRKQLVIEKRVAATFLKASPGIAKACKNDLAKFCASVKPGGGRTHHCLRSNMKSLSAECKKAEFDEMADEAEDIAAQPWLMEKCKVDLQNLCKIQLPQSLKGTAKKIPANGEPGAVGTEQDNGKAKECLKEKLDKKMLQPDCKQAVEEQIKFELQDIRINYRAFKACKPSIEKFCKELPKASGEVLNCLFSKMIDTPKEIGKMCRSILGTTMVMQSKDWKRNYRIRKSCKLHVQELCSDKAIDDPSTVINCLADNIKKIPKDTPESKTCRRGIFFAMQYQLQDGRSNMELAKKCKADKAKFCNDVKPGQGRTRTCLQENFDKISKDCKDAEFKTKKYFQESADQSPFDIVKMQTAKLKKLLKEVNGKLGSNVGKKVDVTTGNLKGNMKETGGLVLKGPMALLALSGLCLVVMMGFYYFYTQFKRSSKSYTVVVNKGG